MTGKIFFALDFIAFFVILFISVAVRRGVIDWTIYINNCKIFLPIFLMASFILWVFSFYDVKALRKQDVRYKRLFFAWAAVLLFSSTFIYFLSAYLPLATPKAILIATLVLYFGYVYYQRKTYFSLDFIKPTLLLFGQSETINDIRTQNNLSNAFKLKEISSDSDDDIDLVIIDNDLSTRDPRAWTLTINQFIAKGIRVDTDFNVYEQIFRRVSRESILKEHWLLKSIGSRRENSIYNMLKKVLDWILALCLLPFLIPMSILICLLIYIIDREQPLFRQTRVGYMGQPVTLYKFRTIKKNNQESNQEELTKTGAFLRRFRLDEIPQIINVLRGDISFIGPRPIWSKEAEFLAQKIPHHNLRTLVKPGITGWSQINFKAPFTYVNLKGESPEARKYESAFIRFSYDVWYIKNRSILLDIGILFRTALRVFIKDSYVAK